MSRRRSPDREPPMRRNATHTLPLATAALCCGFLLLYLATLTEVHTFDALSYVTSVERKPWQELFHPHHLAYGPLGAAAFGLAGALGYQGSAALPLQVVNALAGALGAALFFHTLAQAIGRIGPALAAALLLGGSYAFWYYAVEIEVYTVAALFLIICLRLMLQQAAPSSQGWTTRTLLLLGLAQGGATLFHQTNVLLCAPLLVYAIADLRATRVARPWLLRWGAYALALALTVGLPYLFAGFVVSGFRSVPEFVAWLTEYARTGWWGGPISGDKIGDLGIGLTDTLAQPGGAALWLLLGVAALWGVRRGGGGGARAALLPLGVWLFVYGAFFFWWEPDNIEFWIASLPPALTLLAFALDTRRGRPWPLGIALGVALTAGAINYGAIAQRGDATRDLQRVIARALAAQTTTADLLILPDGLLELYMPHYEARENFISLNQAIFDAGRDWDAACSIIQGRIEVALHAGATAMIAEAALRPPAELLGRHQLTQPQVDSCFAPYAPLLAPLALPAQAPPYFALPKADAFATGDGWRFAAAPLGWQATSVRDVQYGGAWRFVPEVDPALLSPLLDIEANRFVAIEIRMANGTNARDAQIFYAAPDGSIAEERSLRWELAPTTEPTTYTLDLSAAPGWEGRISRLRIDPVGVGDGGVISVESVRFIARR
jgi:hypothetical protein